MRTALYARISDDRHDGAGVERQLQECRRLVEGPDVQEFIDNDVSASRFTQKKRPQYQRMLDLIKSGQIDAVVCWKLDRLYRRPRELEDLLGFIENRMLTIKTVTAGLLDLSTSQGRTNARIVAAMDNQASENTSERVKAQKRQAKEQGRLLGGPRAFGWTKKNPDVRGSPLVPVPSEVALIRSAVDLLLRGASLNDVARAWNSQDVPTPQGRRDRVQKPDGPADYRGRWTPTTVKNVVSNKRHVGPVIDAKKFNELQALLERRSTFARVPRRRSLLTGLAKCSLCGATMVRTGALPGRHAWRCPAKPPACGKVSIAADGLEHLLVEATLLHADQGDLVRIVKRTSSGDKQDRVMRDLDALSAQEEDLSKSFASRKLPITAFEKATTALEAERRALTASLASMSSASIIAPYAGKPGMLRVAWPQLTVDQQREIIRMVLGKVEVTPTRKAGLPRFDPKRVRIAAGVIHRRVTSGASAKQ